MTADTIAPTAPAPQCTWCTSPATHLTIAPLEEIWPGNSHNDKRRTWTECCPHHRRAVSKRRPATPWRPKFPQIRRDQ